jgi:hypothetical protein
MSDRRVKSNLSKEKYDEGDDSNDAEGDGNLQAMY